MESASGKLGKIPVACNPSPSYLVPVSVNPETIEIEHNHDNFDTAESFYYV